MAAWTSVLLAFCLAALLAPSLAINCAGCTPLDEISFDKIVNKFKASLVKFDVAYPYGEEHDEFAKIAKDALDTGDLFVGEVGVKDYAERDNERLAERFDLSKEDFPAVILFVQVEGGGEGNLLHYRFGDKLTAEGLKKFVRQKSGIYLSLPGCIEEFDKLVDKLLAGAESDQESVLKEAEDLWDKTHGPRMAKRADIYVKLMRKVVAVGPTFVAKEAQRVKKLLGGKISSEKKEELEEKSNILKSFTVFIRDEL